MTEKLEIIKCPNGVGEWEIYPTGETFDTRREAEERLRGLKQLMKGQTEFSVSFTLKRDNDMREHDETFFDVQHIKDEIESWLTDLDFVVSDINIKERGNGA